MSTPEHPGPPEQGEAGVPGQGAEVPPAVTDEDGRLVGAGADEVAGTGVGDAEAVGLADELTGLTAELAERTNDLQRLQADYTNYRRRVERDRELAREQTVVATLAELLPVLDDIGRAREHGELVGGFQAVGEALEQAVAKLGLERFGEAGDPFDPEVHEALSHLHSPDVTETTAVEVYQPGYRLGERIVRPARVVVADPAP